MYGLGNKASIASLSTMICKHLGFGKNKTADLLMVETALAETHGGEYKDNTPFGAGRGVAQCDLIGFNDVIHRTRQKDKDIVSRELGYNLDKCSHKHLDDDPILALIICRLHYKLRPEEVPKDVEGRAKYWKTFYNTSAGKGTVKHYLSLANNHYSR